MLLANGPPHDRGAGSSDSDAPSMSSLSAMTADTITDKRETNSALGRHGVPPRARACGGGVREREAN